MNILELQEKPPRTVGKYWFKKETETNKRKWPFIQAENKITRVCALLWYFFFYKKMQLREGLKSYVFFRATDRSIILHELFPFMWKALISQNSNAWVSMSSGYGLKNVDLGHRKTMKPEVVLNSWSAGIHMPVCTETVFYSAISS